MRIGARPGVGLKRIIRAGRTILALAGLAAFGVFAAPRVVPAVEEAIGRLGDALDHRGESADDALERLRGTPYMEALRKIRATIPPDAAYYLVPVEGEGAAYIVRFDLAPRRPVLLREILPTSHLIPGSPRWVVVAHLGGAGPELVDAHEYFRREGGS